MRNIIALFLFIALFAQQAFICSSFAGNNDTQKIFQEFSQKSNSIHSLQTTFIQKKYLSFLENPLTSKGIFSFVREYNTTKLPAILWEYTSPAPSGLWFRQNEGYMWMQDRSQIHKAQGAENALLSTMLDQMLTWFSIDADKLFAQYDIQQDKATPLCFALTPRADIDDFFFTELSLCLNEDISTLKSLTFTEKQGDRTELVFATPVINTNTLTSFPDGSPLP